MALKISLKAHERIVIGGAVVANGSTKCELFFENKVPILREKDIMTEAKATSPARQIYFVIQLMYIDEQQLALHHKHYWGLINDFLKAVPSALPMIDQMNDHILKGEYYTAMKSTQKLIDYEQEVVARVSKPA